MCCKFFKFLALALLALSLSLGIVYALYKLNILESCINAVNSPTVLALSVLGIFAPIALLVYGIYKVTTISREGHQKTQKLLSQLPEVKNYQAELINTQLQFLYLEEGRAKHKHRPTKLITSKIRKLEEEQQKLQNSPYI